MKLAFVACLPAGLALTVPIAANAQTDGLVNSAPSEASTGSQAGVLTGQQIREQSRVTGKPVPGIVQTEYGTTARAPGMSFADIDPRTRADLSPSEIGSRAPLGRKPITEEDLAPKPTAAGRILAPVAGMELTPGSAEPTSLMDRVQSQNARAAYEAEQANKPSWLERLQAAADENWLANQIVRGLDNEADRPDPAWAEKFSKNLLTLTADARDEDEWEMLTSPMAQATEAGYNKAKQAMLKRRRRIEMIYADDNGTLFALFAFASDPIKIIILFIVAIIFRNPYRKVRMGIHLARMTSVLERVERTRITMPIGAGGGIDSLPKSQQIIAVSTLERGISYLKNFEKSDVTDGLIKNIQTAQIRELHTRHDGMKRLLELLIKENVAMDLISWAKLRNVDINNMILD